MTGGQDKSVIRRMASVRAEPASKTGVTPAKVLKNALARAGEDALGVPIGLLDMTETRVPSDEAAKDLPDPSLILRLNGPDHAIALAVVCPQLTAAVIEAKTLGQVLTSEAQARKATSTDARLVGGFLGLTLEKLVSQAENCPEMPPLRGYSAGAPLADARVAAMALAEEKHVIYRLQVDFDGGAKVGTLIFIFPTVTTKKAEVDPELEAWRGTLEKSVLGAKSCLEAVLCTLRLPLSEVTGLSVGDVLHLNEASLDDVSVLASDTSKIVTAQLGRSGPIRAVRVYIAGEPPKRSPPPEEMTSLSMNSDAVTTMPSMETDPMDAMPQLPAMPEDNAMPSFAPPAMEEEDSGFPEGGFSINQLEAS